MKPLSTFFLSCVVALGIGFGVMEPGRASANRAFASTISLEGDVSFWAEDERWTGLVQPFLKKYCVECHQGEDAEAEVRLDVIQPTMGGEEEVARWLQMREVIRSRQMPPPDQPQPEESLFTEVGGWIQGRLMEVARRERDDPGPSVIRRLNHREYDTILRDLTCVESLELTHDFPVDGAAGEGFTNAAAALAISPGLFDKYVKGARELGKHLVLLPAGVRFSEATTSRDWTNETLREITSIYARHVGADGRLDLRPYFARLQAMAEGREQVGEWRGNDRYVEEMRRVLLEEMETSLFAELQEGIRKQEERVGQVVRLTPEAMVERVQGWQRALWRQQNVGHMKRWQVPVEPLQTEWVVSEAIGPRVDGGPLLVQLWHDAPAGESAQLRWKGARLVLPKQSIPLGSLSQVTEEWVALRGEILGSSSAVLEEIARSLDASQGVRRGVGGEVSRIALQCWRVFLGLEDSGGALFSDLYTERMESIGGYNFVQGWGSPETPSVAANGSDQDVRVPGNMPARRVAVHPSPTQSALVGWQAPIGGRFTISGSVTHAHPECGNGVVWSLEHRRGNVRRSLASGVSQGGKPVEVPRVEGMDLRKGDGVALLVGPRDGNHACDWTLVDLQLVEEVTGKRWELASDVSGSIMAGNPHADSQGNAGVWHFSRELTQGQAEKSIPVGSLLDRWLTATELGERLRLGEALERQLMSEKWPEGEADRVVYQKLRSVAGPLLSLVPADRMPKVGEVEDLVTEGSRVWEIPGDLFGGGRLEGVCVVEESRGVSWSQPRVVIQGEALPEGVVGRLDPSRPLLVAASTPLESGSLESGSLEGTSPLQRVRRDMERFRNLFPAAYCYYQIVPVDEVITLTLFHREDELLSRWLLSEEERRRLDRLWSELRYISRDAEVSMDAFEQLLEYASQDGDPRLFEPLRPKLKGQVEESRRVRKESEVHHVAALKEWAARAWRGEDLSEIERLGVLYGKLRGEEVSHEEALGLMLVRILTSPRFLYHVQEPREGSGVSRIGDDGLAMRMSLAMWSSVPDEELWSAAERGELREGVGMKRQMERMLRDRRSRRMAMEFGCQWLHVYDFDELDEKSERHFPEFAGLRGDMYEEVIRFLEYVVREDRSILELVEADYVLANGEMAKFYGLEVGGEEGWGIRRGVKERGRGGILGMAATLAKQSGASRSSPILRGNWVSEVLLGEKLPRPPPGVPPLPAEESELEGESVRGAIERHSRDVKCMGCHRRIDPLGFALEGYDAIGRLRSAESQRSSLRVTTVDGHELEGLEGLKAYVATTRREAFVRQFCRKLLGYSLGRGLRLADEPLVEEMEVALAENGYRFSAAMEVVLGSRPFQYQRDMQYVAVEGRP